MDLKKALEIHKRIVDTEKKIAQDRKEFLRALDWIEHVDPKGGYSDWEKPGSSKRPGTGLAYVIAEMDVRKELERLEDEADAQDLQRALEENAGKATIPFEDVKKELGLGDDT